MLRLLGTAVIIVAALIVVAVTYSLEVRTANRAYSASVDRLLILEDLKAVLLEAESSQRGYVITGETLFRDELAGAVARIDAQFAAVGTNLDPRDFERLERLGTQRMSALMAVVDVYDSDGREHAEALINAHAGRVLMERYRTVSDSLESAGINADYPQQDGHRQRPPDDCTCCRLLGESPVTRAHLAGSSA